MYIIMELCTGGELFDRIKQYAAEGQVEVVPTWRGCIDAAVYAFQDRIACTAPFAGIYGKRGKGTLWRRAGCH